MSGSTSRDDRDVDGAFDWAVYADATLAGLSTLIPLPFVDSAFERFFSRRMPSRIAARRSAELSPYARWCLNRSTTTPWGRVVGCLLFPFRLAVDLVLRLSRKLLYFITIKRAVDSLSHYWQRAYLLDHLIRTGRLTDPSRPHEDVDLALWALETVIDEDRTSPLTKLARELVATPLRLVRGIARSRRGREDRAIDRAREKMAGSWYRVDEYLRTRKARFEEVYRLGPSPTPGPPGSPRSASDSAATRAPDRPDGS